MVIAEPEGIEPAYPGQVGPEVNPVSEELLNRAIRANVELAQALSQLVRDVGDGLGAISAHVSHLGASPDDAQRAFVTSAIETEVRRLQRQLRDIGQPNASRPGTARAPGPPQTPPTPPRGTTAAAPPAPAAAVPSARPSPPPVAPPAPAMSRPVPAPVAPAARPAASPGPAPAAGAPAGASLDGLVADVVQAMRPSLAARPVSVDSRIARGAALPRCSPASLRRALAGLFQGLAVAVAPQTAIVLRAEKKPVLLRGKDGGEMKRDFLMLAATHAGGLAEPDQQRILRGADTGPFGEAQRLVREMGGFIRFAPLPDGALETRVFLPAS
jgi:hypothetical protein